MILFLVAHDPEDEIKSEVSIDTYLATNRCDADQRSTLTPIDTALRRR